MIQYSINKSYIYHWIIMEQLTMKYTLPILNFDNHPSRYKLQFQYSA